MSDGEVLSGEPGFMADSELGTLLLSIFRTINIKVAALLFVVLIFVSTTIYIERVLINFKDTVGPANQVTPKGSVITAMFVCMTYIAIDALVSQGIV